MNVSYELTPDDLADYALFHNTNSPTIRRQRLGCAFMFLAIALMLPAAILLETEDPVLETAVDIWPLLLGPLIGLLVFFACWRWSVRRTSRRMFQEGCKAGQYGRTALSLQDDGIREKQDSGDTFRKWAAVEKIAVTPDYLFVYVSGVEAFIVPRRTFANEDDFDRFVHEIAERSNVEVQRS